MRMKINQLCGQDKAFTVFGANSHRYTLKSIVPTDNINEFETRNKVKLPKQYKDFLTQIGNGICGPNYGLVEFNDALKDDLDSFDSMVMIDPSKRFRFTEKWNDQIQPKMNEDEEEYQVRKDQSIYYDVKQMDGAIRISNCGCGVFVNLVVNGPEKGNIWVDDRSNDQGIYPKYTNQERIGFFDWYENWLDESLQKVTRSNLKSKRVELEKWSFSKLWTRLIN